MQNTKAGKVVGQKHVPELESSGLMTVLSAFDMTLKDCKTSSTILCLLFVPLESKLMAELVTRLTHRFEMLQLQDDLLAQIEDRVLH